VQLGDETQREPDPYVLLQLGNQPYETIEKEASTNPIWEEQFALLCDDPTLQELNVAVRHSHASYTTSCLVY